MRTLAEWLTLQESVHPKSIDMELTRVTAVARALGRGGPAFPVMTVGGTNGKGSTVAHLTALLGARGASTGMFTSPHFIRYNERIRVNGDEVGDQELIAAFERIEAARGATTLTFFEYNTLAALLIFAQRAVDVAVLEVGLAGRLGAPRAPRAPRSTARRRRPWPGGRRSHLPTRRARSRAASASGSRRSMSARWAQRCARCGSPAVSRWCGARWSGSWISRITSPPPRCSRCSCASERCRARCTTGATRDGPGRSSAYWRTRTPRRSPRRSAPSSTTGSCARCRV